MDPATDEPSTDGPRPPGRPRLDRRTVAICVAIAAVAAVITAVVALLLLSGGSDDPARAAGTSQAPGDGLTPAKQAPDTPLTRFDGSALTLDDFRGQKLVVNFFQSTCVPCKKEMPALQKVHQRLGDDVTFLGVAVQDDPNAAQDLVDLTGVTYDLGQDRTGTLFRRIGAAALPTTAFIAEDGTVMELHTGALSEQEITEKISSNLLAGG